MPDELLLVLEKVEKEGPVGQPAPSALTQVNFLYPPLRPLLTCAKQASAHNRRRRRPK